MSFWNFRIVDERPEDLLGLCEVYYNDDGQPVNYTTPFVVGDSYWDLWLGLFRAARGLLRPCVPVDVITYKSGAEGEDDE